eukprot:TRINITY_DN7573_c0_g3_i3.p3 TRINITY_DN7573_c0_g3~~TRINITY_DN7573_c0_g3_i3.p3  ORF type:complete len:100 (-),score=8.13 TRINITY_DN7573_c0_g3_i3:122-421(-)
MTQLELSFAVAFSHLVFTNVSMAFSKDKGAMSMKLVFCPLAVIGAAIRKLMQLVSFAEDFKYFFFFVFNSLAFRIRGVQTSICRLACHNISRTRLLRCL